MMPLSRLRDLAPAAAAAAGVPDDWRARFTWAQTLEGFLTGEWDGSPVLFESLSPADALREDAMLGLRRAAGISEVLAEDAGVSAVLGNLQREGLVALVDGRWRATERGWLLGNRIFSAVWAGE
jgi:coproporphyrinogen III oxidase-like Fe-S oxidoreductase